MIPGQSLQAQQDRVLASVLYNCRHRKHFDLGHMYRHHER
jgi:hypothetical protein